MNNSLIFETNVLSEKEIDYTPQLREREQKLIKVIESLQSISKTKEWSTLKAEIFDDLVSSLEKGLKIEAKKEKPDPLMLNRLTGQFIWAERYADLVKLENVFRIELKNLRLKLYGKSE